jgi:hypothetical protein
VTLIPQAKNSVEGRNSMELETFDSLCFFCVEFSAVHVVFE